MGTIPPDDFLDSVHAELASLLRANPAATSNEAYVQHILEFALLRHGYHLRTGINYHGSKVQQIRIENDRLFGWNPEGDALGVGPRAKVLLGGHTIIDREVNEPNMNDSKFAGGALQPGEFVRVEYKVRGWLGKTKNLAGKELEKDLDLLKNDRADLLVVSLSETAHRKWRGEGPEHQVSRRTGCERFAQVLRDFDQVRQAGVIDGVVLFEGQRWRVRSEYVEGATDSWMPGAGHVVTTCSIARQP